MRTARQITSSILGRYVCPLSALFILLEVEEEMVRSPRNLLVFTVCFSAKMIVCSLRRETAYSARRKSAFILNPAVGRLEAATLVRLPPKCDASLD